MANLQWKSYLEKLAHRLKVKLKILILISDDELVQLYNQARLVVYAPYLEPFGLVPLEAMSCGTPVVAVKEGGVRESVKHEYNGVLTERDQYSFAHKITELLQDKQKTEKLVDNSIKQVKEFWTLKHSGKRLLNHLNRAIDSYYQKS